MRSFAWALAAAVAFGCSSPPPSPPPKPPKAAEAEPVAAFPAQLESFDYAWNKIKEVHWDPAKVGASWDAARAELRPKVAAAATEAEARAVIGTLLARLGQSHFGVSPRASGSSQKGSAGVGVELRMVGKDVVVFRRSSQGPASAAGIDPGTQIVAIGGKSVAEIIKPVADKPRYVALNALLGALAGAAGSKIAVTLADGKATRDIELTRAPSTERTSSIGNVEIAISYESRWLDRRKRVAYVRLSAFADPTMVSQRFAADVGRFAKARGLVLDLRGNPGGLGGMAMGMAGHLSDKEAVLGTMISKDSKLKFVANPQPAAYLGKVAVLIDEMCASTCEILAAGLADIGRATTFGTRTAGAALPSLIEQLPSGDLFQYATANYVLASGESLEGAGLAPMVEVQLDATKLRKGADSQLDAAIDWINRGKLR